MPRRTVLGVAAGLALLFAASYGGALGRAASASHPACDYSFLVGQPIFKMVAPEESGTDVSLSTPLGIAGEGGNFSIIKQVELVPESGPIVTLPSNFKPLAQTATHHNRYYQGPSVVVATMSLPQLRPSTTYDVVFTVKTVNAPTDCPSELTEHIARFTTESQTSLDAIALSHEAAQAPTGKASGPEIFENALHTLRTFEYPPVVSFIVTSRSTVGGKPFIESFRSSFRTEDGLVTTHTVPVTTTNQPENPWGWRVNIPILGSLFPNQRKGNYSQPFGVPEISPAYAFGLLPRQPPPFPGMRTPEPDVQVDVKQLGRILTIARDYDATLIDVQPYHERFVYHLKLTPLDRPDFYRVRELWVDTQAAIIWKLRAAGIFDEGPATTVPWDVEYTIVDGHWFMSSEATDSTIKTGGFLANTAPVNYDGVSYTFSDFSYPEDTLDTDFFSEAKTQAIEY